MNMRMLVHIGLHYFAIRIYFDSFYGEYILKEIKKLIDHTSQNKKIISNIFRIQANDSVMCGYVCTRITDFMLAGKKLTDYTNLFSAYDLKKTIIQFCHISKINVSNSIKAIDKIDLSEETKF